MSSFGPPTTSASLLSRARDPNDHAAWRKLEDHYRGLLMRYCRSRGLQHADADDVVQIVFLNLARSLPEFAYDRARGRFRDYLYRCTRNALSDWVRSRNGGAAAVVTSRVDLDTLDPAAPQAVADAAFWEQEWVAQHYRVALDRVRADFDATNVEVFERNLKGESVAALAAAYGITQQAVYAARRRIRARLQELVTQQVRDEDAFDDEPDRR